MRNGSKAKLRQELISALIKSNPYINKENVRRKIKQGLEQEQIQHKTIEPEILVKIVVDLVSEPEVLETILLAKELNNSTNKGETKETMKNKNSSYKNYNYSKRENVQNQQSQRNDEVVKAKASRVSITRSEPLSDAITQHNEGIKGNKQSVKNAYNAFKELAKQQKNNLEVQSYLGSATALLGRDASSVTDKMKYALEGLKILDEVVQASPNLIIARFLRGNVSYRLPELYFQRTATAIEDFSFLVDAYEKDASILSEGEYAEVLKNVIDACKRSNQSEKATMFQEKLKSLKSKGNQVITNTTALNESPSISTSKSRNQESAEGLTDEAISMYQQALIGGPTQVKEALDFFGTFVLTNTAPEVEMHYLDVQSMIGRDSINTYEMFGSAIKSMKAMDSLINEYPTNSDLRLVRAKHSLRLPENFFRRAATAVNDIEYLLKEYASNPASMNKETYQQLLLDLGIAYERLEMVEEAKEAWNKLLQTNPSNEIQQIVNEKQELYSYNQRKLRVLSAATKDKFYEEAKALHAIGAKGNKQAAKQSLEAWEKARLAYPDCEVANTYYAASVALIGKLASDPQKMFAEAMKGLKLLKSSIKTNNPELKYLRGYIYHVLPEGFFHSSDKAVKDLNAVKTAYENNRKNPPITEEQYLKLLYDLGHLYKRTSFLDKAEKTWKTLLKVGPGSKYADLLASQGVNVE